jgi:transcriptional regulator with XRE-family HTH domain
MRLRQVVARNLRVLRKQKGLSQEELAFKAEIEREEKSPTVDMIEKLADALGVDPAAFMMRPQKRRG